MIPFAALFQRTPKRVLHRGYFEGVLGTSLEIQVVSSGKEAEMDADNLVLGEIERLEAIFNAYKPSSALSQWQQSHEKDLTVPPELAQVLEIAENWRHQTQGAFNPAVESLTRLWNSHAKTNTEVSPAEVEPLVAQLKPPLWSADTKTNTARRHTGLAVTLNSIAKGYIIDRACQLMASQEKVQEVLINIGGDIRHSGDKGVDIAIADPHNDAENAEPACRIKLHNQGVATSGNYRRGFQIGERWYSHLIDPRTGYPVEESVGVSVVATDAMTADVLATAFSVLKPEESLALADSHNDIGVFIVDARGNIYSNSFWEKQQI